MLSFFRRALSSWVVLGLLALLMIGFVITGVGTPNGLGLDAIGGSGEAVAKVGGHRITGNEISGRMQQQIDVARRDNPTLDTAAFIAGGGFEPMVDGLITSVALDQWARDHGFAVNDRLVDGQIASIPAFAGPTGRFDRATFDRLLAQQRITEKQLREDLSGDLIRRQLLGPIGGAARTPTEVARIYASLLLEKRTGTVGVVPASAITDKAEPTAAEINAFYSKNIASYTLPERRVIRYALVGGDKVTAAAPSDAEIAAYYKANAAAYAASESRSFSQIVLPQEAAARAFVAKVRGGTSFADAAKAAGFAEADTKLGKQSKAQLTDLVNAAAAELAFKADEGALLEPQKSPLGWHVIRVDAIEKVGGKSLADVRGEIANTLAKQKQSEGLAKLIQTMEDELDNGATFDEVVAKHKLASVTTPPVAADATAPGTPGFTTPPELKLMIKAAFDADVDDDPTVETIGGGGAYALLDVTQVVAPAPIPLQQARESVIQALRVEKAFGRAREIAIGIANKIKAGTPIDKAFASAPVKLPAPQPVSGRQAELARGGNVPRPLQMMFSMTQGATRLVRAPEAQGWFIVHLDSIERGDAAKVPGLVGQTEAQLSGITSNEYAEQFANAVEKSLKVTRDEAALARVKAQLASGSAPAQ